MWPRATNPENWLPQSQFIKVISTVRIGRTGGSEIHERVAQLFVVVHTLFYIPITDQLLNADIRIPGHQDKLCRRLSRPWLPSVQKYGPHASFDRNKCGSHNQKS